MIGFNTTADGLCVCLRTTYYKVSVANFIHDDGRAVTGVAEICETR